jgi:hypothetical protein
MLDTEPFSFSLSETPTLPITEYRWCSYGKHFLPATPEHFAKSRDGRGQFRYQTYCRPCMGLYRRARYHRLKEAGEWDQGRRRRE